MPKLTKLERAMLLRSAEFVFAGEWPWEGDDSKAAVRIYIREHAALLSAAAKLSAAVDIDQRNKKDARVKGSGVSQRVDGESYTKPDRGQ